MKFLHLADLHIGKRVNGFSMLEDQKYVLGQIAGIITEHQTDAVLIAGDVYDKAIPSAEAVSVFDTFLTTLAEHNQKVFIISGNHDSAERIAFGGQLMKHANVYVSSVFHGQIEKVTVTDAYGEIGIYLLPFIRPAMVKTAYQLEQMTNYDEAVKSVLKHQNIQTDQRNIVLVHQFLTGASPSESEEFSIGGMENISASLFDDFDYVALGHIHRAQKVMRDEVRYAGTVLKYSFSEATHKKSVTLVELREKGTVEIKELPIKPLRDLREIKGSYNEITLRENYSRQNTDDYVHITLTDEEDILDVVNRLRLIYPNLMRLDYDNQRTRQNREVLSDKSATTKSPMELFADFYETQNNQPMTEEQLAYAKSVLEKVGGAL